ncbi:bifunctional adenosylcobinamide kinase/adenosylcobinamide-phosphate guanylyltransferase [Dyadobacter aurulentus]|uniref:bifunctional adenosylcobinamide kinase/adenosylcobinamide-phosphate guanylyltransferase n=1 Tax=Dyadobacter sp. UC 10 TaxID=2605428 RepID=UPI0011F12337|nr:bifunctional adenosylcobinamide kinase/adenosylcobinamide-phosphate guanylyltransferase [Dyadobacter sp. UC 10]KAA0993325.1 bifunctional adenosylcobinamide kinase/adenosylcobinamide-phosphate guanylyltransferase [Dyadobacter sp. UC 10]
MIIYISGGARSGKSGFAQEMALKLSEKPVYVATAKVWDENFAERVARHKADRGPEWSSIEAERDIHLQPIARRTVVIDCITLWLTNLFIQYDEDMERTLTAFKADIDSISAMEGTFIIISNEIGMGVHAATEMGRKFTDLQGWANQYVATKAGEAVFMVSGLPLWLKKSS